GERVSADGVVAYERNLHVDESILTGESIPVRKIACDADRLTDIDESSRVLAGSFVTEGRARVVVLQTGDRTMLGEINTRLKTIRKEESPFEKRMKRVSVVFTGLAAVFIVQILILSVYKDAALPKLLLLSVAVLVGTIPEGLPAVITVVLSVGIYRLAKRKVIVRNLAILESLGLVEVICTDKTGTLTENRMTVRSVYTPAGSFSVSSTPDGSLRWSQTPTMMSSLGASDDTGPPAVEQHKVTAVDHGTEFVKRHPQLETLMTLMVLCNDAEIYHDLTGATPGRVTSPDDVRTMRSSGSPTEVAILTAADSLGITKEIADEAWPRVTEIPFSSDRKFMATLHRRTTGTEVSISSASDSTPSHLLVVKGAPEVVEGFLERPSGSEHIVRECATQGLRVLACAYKMVGTRESIESGDLTGMTFAGLCAMNDPPRRGVREYVETCRRAGINVVMITGDNEYTARSIGHEVGIYRPERGDRVVTGSELDKMDDTGLDEALNSTTVFARTNPLHKLRIVSSLLRRGSITAMTGDGVNDSPALRQASVGIAMGVTGTDIAKEASDVVLHEEKFETVVEGIDEGRNVLSNLRKVIQFYLTTGIAQNVLIIASLILFSSSLLSPLQILWVNLAATGLTDIGLGMEPKERGLLERPPPRLADQMISRDMVFLSLVHAVYMVAVSVSMYALYLPVDSAKAVTIGFLSFVILQWYHSLNCRSHVTSIVKLGVLRNRALIMSIIASFGLVLLLVVIPGLSAAFDVVPLDLTDWLLMGAAGLSIVAFDEIRKYLLRSGARH
ncbi:MAG: cation-transporting P-type ATPase, partial [Candidatus Thorarchaeota archaeon]